ncbi:N-acetyltransferase 9 [Piptocephalis cylindrospora]|uniref:N-acetyltransferase 9 n=1 Tax=Piptocephalis cylindrospora TaxID=1907219 RepID=A0A4P9Y3Y6_9FUNG|nr:N-acetyltransferase 9 [Piptocephalis cylindrospora]|eukprot:RKP13637.1 N-acetyltransferase 9 [Piptocephalis cylindrospora]
MRTNENIVLVGSKVALVPYRREHVGRYHDWMKSIELQELTASEPLSLEAEYDMQASWHTDADKCTFILVDHPSSAPVPSSWKDLSVHNMVGDVNFFLNEPDDPKTAEVEIMLAEPAARGRGLGLQALAMMLMYGVETLGLHRIISKIGMGNTSSLRLFQDRLGFVQISESAIFQEVTLSLSLTPDSDALRQVRDLAGRVEQMAYRVDPKPAHRDIE